MAEKKAEGLAGLWSGINLATAHRLQSAKDYLRHPASGINAEHYIRQLLRDYLPSRFGIESGFVVNATGERSDFIDILIVDALNIAPLSAEPSYKVFPAEAVLAAVEITSAVQSSVKRHGVKLPKLADDILKLARLRAIAKHRQYYVNVPAPWNSPPSFQTEAIEYELSPRCLLITFGSEWSKRKTYVQNLTKAIQIARAHSSTVWINAVYSFSHGMFRFKPYTTDPPEWVIAQSALLEFILSINSMVASVPTGGIDVRRYRPTIPEEPEQPERNEQ